MSEQSNTTQEDHPSIDYKASYEKLRKETKSAFDALREGDTNSAWHLLDIAMHTHMVTR